MGVSRHVMSKNIDFGKIAIQQKKLKRKTFNVIPSQVPQPTYWLSRMDAIFYLSIIFKFIFLTHASCTIYQYRKVTVQKDTKPDE